MIELRSITKDYGKHRAVEGVSATIAPGSVTGLLGPNGAGKTSIIRMITGLIAPTMGQVSVGGHDTVTDSAKARACVGYLPEFAPLYPEMTPESHLRYRAGLFGMAAVRATEAIERVIERCWLSEMRTKRIGALSKGYKQRVALAAAILHDPSVIILDEPTTGLDPAQIRETRQLLRELARPSATHAGGRVVLLSSHILPDVQEVCDRILIIARGRLQADGTPTELMAKLDASPYVVEVVSGTGAAAVEAFAGGLRGIGGVMRVDVESGRLRVTPAHDAPDLREAIAHAAVRSGVVLRELTRVRPSLEQVFLRAIGDEQKGAA